MQAAVEETTITAILKSDFNFYKETNKKIPSVLRDGIFYGRFIFLIYFFAAAISALANLESTTSD